MHMLRHTHHICHANRYQPGILNSPTTLAIAATKSTTASSASCRLQVHALPSGATNSQLMVLALTQMLRMLLRPAPEGVLAAGREGHRQVLVALTSQPLAVATTLAAQRASNSSNL